MLLVAGCWLLVQATNNHQQPATNHQQPTTIYKGIMEDTKSQHILFIINDGPYGNERAYNALRLALNLVKRPGVTVRVSSLAMAYSVLVRGKKRLMAITMLNV